MNWLSSFFSSGNWIGPTLLAGATIYSASTASKANKQAAQIANQSSQQQASTLAAATDRQTEAIERGTSLARQQFAQIQDTAAPAITYQREVMAAPTVLQPWQQSAVEDARRNTLNALSVSGLRGSGRATVEAVRKVEGDVTGQFLQGNQRRSDSAASSLANQYFNAGQGIANAEQTAAARTASAIGTGGIYSAQALSQQGVNNAAQTVAEAELRGKALGDLGTIINDTWKSGRRGEYEPKQKTIGQ